MSVNKKRREWRQINRYVTNQLNAIHSANIHDDAFHAARGGPSTDAISTTSDMYVSVGTVADGCSAGIGNTAGTSVQNIDKSSFVTFCDRGSETFTDQRSQNVTAFERQCQSSGCGAELNYAFDEKPNESSLKTFLQNWAVDNNISLSHLSSLLKGLKSHCCSTCSSSLPFDGRSLLKTDRNISSKVQNKAGGSYVHLGVAKCIQSHISCTTDNSEKLIAIVNIDGLPIFKSSGLVFWPILIRIINGDCDKPFVVGIYSGTTKPHSVHDYLSEFVSEMVSVISDGITIGDNHFDVTLKCIMTDAPALAMIKCIKGHCGYSGCPRCIQEGSRAANCTVFLETDAALRTDDAFRSNLYEDDHQCGISPLLALPIDMIKDIPFDYMHLVCLGVVKRLLNMWISGPLPSRVPSRLIQEISARLLLLRGQLPHEFARQPRSLVELARWKATEFRQFLLYTGILVLDGILQQINPKMYLNFLLLHTAIQIMCRPALLNDGTIKFAHECLVNFIRTAAELYGEQMVVYNVHGLTHLSEDVARHGCLDSYSCFPFENYMSSLKRCVHSPNNPLAQVVCRIEEQGLCQKAHSNKKLKKGLSLRNGLVRDRSPDNCVRLTDGNVGIVLEQKRTDDGWILMCKLFRDAELFFAYPCSSLNLGIAVVSHLGEEVTAVKEVNVFEKMVLLPKGDSMKFVALPLFHCDK
jgi:hypothetical protein